MASAKSNKYARTWWFEDGKERVTVECLTYDAFEAIRATWQDELRLCHNLHERAARNTILFIEGAIRCGATHVTLTRESIQ